MHIFYASDNNYAQHLCVSMVSVLRHTNFPISFHVIDGGISKQNKKKINKLFNSYKRSSVEYLSVDKGLFKDFWHSERFPVEAYYRLLIPKIRPEINKAIYLDCDLVAKCCLSGIYDIDITNYCAAASEDHSMVAERRKPDFDLDKNTRYFNSGVLLLNLDKIRKEKLLDKAPSIAKKYKDKMTLVDQDLLNVLFLDKIIYLSPDWNVMASWFQENKYQHKHYSYELFEYCKNNPKIVHYAGRSTFWIESDSFSVHKYWKEYYYNLKLTDFYKGIKDHPCVMFFKDLRKLVVRDCLKKLRRWVFRIKFAENHKVVRVFGINFVNKRGV